MVDHLPPAPRVQGLEKEMKIKISIPNDYGSNQDYMDMLGDLYGSTDDEALIEMASQDNGERCYEELAFAAKSAGLKFHHGTDYGAVWQGSKAKCKEAIANLPGWARIESVE